MKVAHQRLQRLLFLLPYVNRHPRGVPMAALARMLDTTVARLRRDVDGIRFAGVPGGEAWQQLNLEILDDGPEPRLVVNVAGPLSRPPRLTGEEAYALILGAAAVKGRGHKRFDEALSRAERKVRRILRETLPEVERDARVALVAGRERKDVVSRLTYAQEKTLTVELDYASMGRGARRVLRVEPYGLLNHHGFFYLVGRSLAHDEVRILKVERISHARLLPRRFKRPADFNVRDFIDPDFLAGGTGTVQVRLRLRGPSAASLASGFARKRRQPNGDHVVAFKGHVSDALMGWILRAGAAVQVIEPAALAERVHQAALRIVDQHG